MAYSRPGVHNQYLVLFVKASSVQPNDNLWMPYNVDREALLLEPEPPLDEAMQRAIAEAYDLELDQYVFVTVTIDESFGELLSTL